MALYFCFTSLITFYYGTALVFISLTVLCFLLWKNRKSNLRNWFKNFLQGARKPVFITLVLLGPITSIMFYQKYFGPFNKAAQSWKSLQTSSVDLIAHFIPDHTVARASLWDRSRINIDKAYWYKKNLAGSYYEKSVYAGILSWLTLLVALLFSPLRKRTWPFIILFFFFFIFSLGPTLFVYGKPYLTGLLPARMLAYIPLANVIRGVSRFSYFMPLAAGIIFALGLTLIPSKFRFAGPVLALIAITVTLWEFLPGKPLTGNISRFNSPYYEKVLEEKGDYGIMNVPLDYHGAKGGADIYLYTQVYHQKPMLGGMVSREPPSVLKRWKESPLIQAFYHADYGNRRIKFDPTVMNDFLPTLKKLKVKYVILHKVKLHGDDLSKLSSAIEQKVGSPSHQDKEIVVFTIPI